jgi:hypothetical protein
MENKTETKEEKEVPNIAIPKYLVIKVNTRIKTARRFDFQPRMIDKNTRASYVLFDPLIELKNGSFKENPFFSQSLFDLAKDASLHKSIFGQKKKDLEGAVKSGFIENNVKVTLDTLFKRNTPFYVNNKTYKVNSYMWDKKYEIVKNRAPSYSRSYQSPYNSRSYGPYRSAYNSRSYGPYRSAYRPYQSPYSRSYNSRSAYRPTYTRRRRRYRGGNVSGSYVYVNIFLELEPPEGTKTRKNMNMDCMAKYEKLKMDYAALTGTVYRMDGTLD